MMVKQGLAQSREKAQTMIESGFVSINGKIILKPSCSVEETSLINVNGSLPYVGRGGLKLEKALKVFHVDPFDSVCLDIGSSTGGFTDCLLKNGASFVWAVDVGQDQLDPSLRFNPRVCSLEKTDIRFLDPKIFLDRTPRLAVCDVSFISLGIIFPHIARLTLPDSFFITLIKPQFEAGKTKKGIVSSSDTHKDVIRKVLKKAEESSLQTLGLDYSPIRGGDGNIEFLLYGINRNEKSILSNEDIDRVVCLAHTNMRKKE